MTFHFGIVTDDFGNVTGRFGNVTQRTGQQDWRCACHQPRRLCSPALAGETMPAHRMNMRTTKDVLRLKFDAGFSHDRIAASLGISKGVVTKCVGLAGAAGLIGRALATWTKASSSGGCSASLPDLLPTPNPTAGASIKSYAVKVRR